AFASKRDPSVLQRALTLESDVQGRCGELGLADDVDLGHAGEIDREPALASARGCSNPLGWQVGKKQDEDGLGTRASDVCIKVDLRTAELDRLAQGVCGKRDVGTPGVAAKLEGCPGRLALARGDETDMKIERHQAGEVWRLGHVVGQAEQARGDA